MDEFKLERTIEISVGVGNGADSSPREVSLTAMLAITRGLYGVFWGMLLVVLSTVHLWLVVPRQIFAEAICVLSIGVLIYGSWLLFRTRSLNPTWNKRICSAFISAILVGYFCLFFFMWIRVQDNAYLRANAIGFALSMLLFSALISRAISSLVAMLSEYQLARETQLVTTSSWGIILVPSILGFGYALRGSIMNDTSILSELLWMLRDVHWLTLGIALLPFAQALSVVWIAKDAVLDQLHSCDDSHP